MSEPIECKEIEDRLRAARDLNAEIDEKAEIDEERRRERQKKVYAAEFQRLIIQDLGRQAGEIYRRQLKHGKDCA